MYFYYDSTYILVMIGFALVMWAQYSVTNTFNKYNELPTKRSMTGKQAAELMLQATGLSDVRVEHTPGNLSDHYDPRGKILRLSDSTYQSTSVAAVAVAAHECGHALQDAEGYLFLKVRTAIVPITNIGSQLAMPMIFIGLILNMMQLVKIGIIAFATVLVFQLVTLPVELNASHRALRILTTHQVFAEDEIPAARAVLRAAAFTYVAATLNSALTLLRFILLSNRRRD